MLRANFTSLMKVHKRRNYAQDTYNHNVVFSSVFLCVKCLNCKGVFCWVGLLSSSVLIAFKTYLFNYYFFVCKKRLLY